MKNPIKSWIELFIIEPKKGGFDIQLLEQVENFSMARMVHTELKKEFNVPVNVVICCQSLEGKTLMFEPLFFN